MTFDYASLFELFLKFKKNHSYFNIFVSNCNEMLEINRIREEKELVISGLLKKRHMTAEADVDLVIELDKKRREKQGECDASLSESNKYAKQIGMLMKEGKKEEAEEAKKASTLIKTRSQDLEKELKSINDELNNLLVTLPNIPHSSVPEGNSDADNEIVKTEGEALANENSKPHWDIIKESGEIDFELGNKITGAGFPVYKGAGAKRQRELINMFLDYAV